MTDLPDPQWYVENVLIAAEPGPPPRWVDGPARRWHALFAAGAARRRPREVVSGRSGAVLHGLPTLSIPARPELTACGRSGLGEIDGALQRAAGWPGARRARDLLALTTPLAESPLESLTRLALHDDGFPPPTLQARIGRYRVDFYWPEYGLVAEADGRAKYTDDELWREKRREHRLRREVRQVERVLWSDVLDNWPDTSRRLRGFMG